MLTAVKIVTADGVEKNDIFEIYDEEVKKDVVGVERTMPKLIDTTYIVAQEAIRDLAQKKIDAIKAVEGK